jgi:hypothetical protein
MLGILKRLKSRTRSLNPFRSRRQINLNVENLESRTLLSFTPTQVAHAYGFDNVTIYDNNWNPIAQGDGSGQTIAVVIAYDNPYINSDLAAFDAQYHIPDPPSFGKAFPQGTPAFNSGWAQESALDVEYSHAVAPGANILLVEARSNSLSDLFGAVDYARNYPGVSVVSMSWGTTEFPGETAYDGYFTTPNGHNGVSFVASSGDTGGTRSYPAMSPYVLSVGGTTLSTSDSQGTYRSESAWSGSGGGISSYESQPWWQAGFSDNYSTTNRTGPDVSYVGNPSTGVTIIYAGQHIVLGGTSVGAPQWAGMLAIADQQMNAWGYDTLDGSSLTLPGIYQVASWYGNGAYDGADYHDVVGGSAGGNQAVAGYDLATGLGSPIAPSLAVDLAYQSAQNIDGGPYGSSVAQGGASVADPAPSSLSPVSIPLSPSSPRQQTPPLVGGGTGSTITPPTQGKNITAKTHSIFLDDPTSWQLVAQANSINLTVSSSTVVNIRGSDLRAPIDGPTTLRSSLFIRSTPRLAHSEVDMDLGDVRLRPDDVSIPMQDGAGAASESRMIPIIAPVNGGDLETANLALSALSPDAVDAFFASDSWLKSFSDTLPALSEAGPAANPLAAMAGLAVVMGGYWGAHVTEPESRGRFPRLQKTK